MIMLQMVSRMRTIYGFLLETGQEAPVPPLIKVEDNGAETTFYFEKLGCLLISTSVKPLQPNSNLMFFLQIACEYFSVFYVGLEHVSLCRQWQAPSQQKE